MNDRDQTQEDIKWLLYTEEGKTHFAKELAKSGLHPESYYKFLLDMSHGADRKVNIIEPSYKPYLNNEKC